MEFNPYLSEEKRKEREQERKQAGPPDVLARLQNYRWQTQESASEHYISHLLGGLAKEGFIFKHSGGWGSWPPEYLHSVIGHIASRNTLFEKWRYEAEQEKKEQAIPYQDSRKQPEEQARVKATSSMMQSFRSKYLNSNGKKGQ